MSTVLTEPAAIEGIAPTVEQAPAARPTFTRTELPTEAKIPWPMSAFLGVGVVAPSGELLGQAVEPFEVKGGSVRTEDIHLTRIETEEDLRREMSGSVEAEYSSISTSGEARARLEKSVEVSERKMTILCTATIQWQEDAVATAYPPLKDVAVKSLEQSPAVFRDSYGDYFIAGYTKKATLSVFAHLTSSSRESMLKVAAEASAKMKGVVSGSATVAASLDEFATTNNCSIQVDIYKDGVADPGAKGRTEAFFGLDLKDVPAHVKDFGKRAVGSHADAILVHYHRIEPRVPTTIELDPQVFMEADRLHGRLVFARVMAKDLPVNYGEELATRLDDIERKVRAKVPRDLSVDLQTLHLLSEEVEDWITDAGEVEDYRKLWRIVMAGGTGVTTWDGPALIEQSPPQNAQGKYTSPGWVRRQLLFAEPGRKVCGFRITANRGDNGSWGIADGGLGKDLIRFWFKSEYDRGTNWTATVWTVPKDRVNFEPTDL